MLHNCECELDAFDLVINVKNSCCMRIGQLSNITCQRLSALSGAFLPWLTEIKYLGVTLSNLDFEGTIKTIVLSCCKRGFCSAGRIASKEVVLHLMSTKCIPILLYSIEACPMRKTDLN